MERLFTFGCSYTHYQWPTWADFVGSTFDVYENWGKAGSGNFIIASKLYECHYVNNITKNDVVLIMLSSCDRFDYIDNHSKWSTQGNIYNKNHSLFGKFTEVAWNQENALYNTWYNVQTIITLLNSIGCRYKIMKAFDFFSIDGKIDSFDTSLYNQKRIINIKNHFKDVVEDQDLTTFHQKKNSTYTFDNGETDGHPTISVHHDWVKENMSEYYKDEMETLRIKWENLFPNKREGLGSVFENKLIDSSFEKTVITKQLRLI